MGLVGRESPYMEAKVADDVDEWDDLDTLLTPDISELYEDVELVGTQ